MQLPCASSVHPVRRLSQVRPMPIWGLVTVEGQPLGISGWALVRSRLVLSYLMKHPRCAEITPDMGLLFACRSFFTDLVSQSPDGMILVTTAAKKRRTHKVRHHGCGAAAERDLTGGLNRVEGTLYRELITPFASSHLDATALVSVSSGAPLRD